MKYDSHLHVWAPPEQTEQFPYEPGQEPNIKGSAEFLAECMKEAGVDGALIVQPINHKFDHSYVANTMRTKNPDQGPAVLVGCCLADPTEGGGGAVELRRLRAQAEKKEHWVAVRFNPYLWPKGEKMTNKVGRAMFAEAGKQGMFVGIMCFKGLLLHIDEIEELCSEFPETKVVLDHFGFCKGTKDKDWERLLGLARFPQVYIKLSAFFRVSEEKYPYSDTSEQVKQLIATFGANRLMWGSDFPFVTEECGYVNAANVLELVSMSKEDRDWIMGKTLQAIVGGALGVKSP